MAGQLPKFIPAHEAIALGGLGAVLINNTSARVGDFGIIQALTDTVFATLNTSTIRLNSDSAAPSNLNGITLLAGHYLYGRFSAITLTSGTCVAYYATALS